MKRMMLFFVLSAFCTANVIAQHNRTYTSLEEVSNPDSVFVLILRHCKIPEFPEVILQMKNLERLDLSWNKMHSLPKEIGTLTKLVYLNLNHNRLDSVPAEIAKLQNLDTLILSRNRIFELPAEMGGMKNLHVLMLLSNGIKKLPDSFRHLDSTLQIIDLRANPLSYDDQLDIKDLIPTPKKRMTRVCNCQ